MSVEVEGFDSLAQSVSLMQLTQAEKDQILEKGASELLDVIKVNAESAYTNRTGNLTGSLGYKKKKGYMKVGSVGAKGNHAHLVEFGHGGPHPAGPHPFVTPAYDGERDRIAREIENEAFEMIKSKL